ncbi:ABC transporter ATP-binding protein [Peptoclostridium acidaminophilum]|nr:ABC transporter ATP-binding protein [Peptoclostridium acidaminophilum]
MIRNVHKVYSIQGKRIQALKGLDFEVESGSFVCIVGKSGCGKSTLLKLICGLEERDSGSIIIRAEENSKKNPRVSIVFQEPRLMPWLSVRKNIEFPIKGEICKSESEKRVERQLDMLGIKAFENAYPSQISGGMAQRVSLGRTLCYEPDIILMDEPLGALDAFNRKKLQDEIVKIFQNEKKTILFVTHDVEEALLLGQKVLVMEEGRIKESINVNMGYPRNPSSNEMINLKKRILSLIFE